MQYFRALIRQRNEDEYSSTRPLKTKIIPGAHVSKHARMHACSKNKLPYALARREKNSILFFFTNLQLLIFFLLSFFSTGKITSTNGKELGMEFYIDVWKKNFNFSPAKRERRKCSRQLPVADTMYRIFGDSGLMYTSHLVNARRKIDRKRRRVECEGWETESTVGGMMRGLTWKTILVREFTSIFISTRHQLFTRPKLLAIRLAIRRPNTSSGWLNGTIVIHGYGNTGGDGVERQGKDYVRVGKDRWFQGRSKATTTRLIIISPGDTTFWLTTAFCLERCCLISFATMVFEVSIRLR